MEIKELEVNINMKECNKVKLYGDMNNYIYYIHNYFIFNALQAGLLFVEKVTKTATRLVARILTKLNSSSLNSRLALRQTAALKCFVK